MNRTFVTTAFVAALGMQIAAQATPVADTYVGGNEHGYGDVIGDSRFQVSSFEMSRSGTNLHVVINTQFAGYGDDALFAAYTRTTASARRGIGYGDVLLSNSWTPYGDAPYKADDHLHGTLWTYGFSLDNRWSATGGAGRLFALNGATNDSNTLLSNDFLSGATFRDGQVIAVDTAAHTVAGKGAGTWTVDSVNHRLLFDFDISGTSLQSDDTLALHWGMTCGNDVIEGLAAVPEPGTLALLAVAMLTAPLVRRRSTRAIG